MNIKNLEKILKALANRRRLIILKYLKDNKRGSVTDLSEHLKLSFKSTSKHLTVLRSADIIEAEQRSSVYVYTLVQPLNSLIKQILLSI